MSSSSVPYAKKAGAVLVALTMVLGGGACSSSGSSDRALPRITQAPPTTGPYVSVAVDNHFHDIHADNDIHIAADRAFVVRNEGSNLHNVTIEGTNISQDISPGESFELDPLGDRLEPGQTYVVICRIHGAQGMVGQFTVDPAD